MYCITVLPKPTMRDYESQIPVPETKPRFTSWRIHSWHIDGDQMVIIWVAEYEGF